MRDTGFEKLLRFLGELEQERVSYTLAHHRDDALMVTVALPGERWEIEFFADGLVEVERFASTGDICGEEALAEISARCVEHDLDEVALEVEGT